MSLWEDLPAHLRKTDPLPRTLDEFAAALEPLFEPAGAKAVSVLLDRLFSVTPSPPDDAIKVWLEMLQSYPADALKRAIDEVILTHRWNTPPLIGNVVEKLDADDIQRSRSALKFEIVKRRSMIASRLRSQEFNERIEANEQALRQRYERAGERARSRGFTIYDWNGTALARLKRVLPGRPMEHEMVATILHAVESEEDELFSPDTTDARVKEIYVECECRAVPDDAEKPDASAKPPPPRRFAPEDNW